MQVNTSKAVRKAASLFPARIASIFKPFQKWPTPLNPGVSGNKYLPT
jgi:hypothetical protein